jgi:glycerol uptake operon antiterminator
MIELMPGIATKAISFFKERVSVPIIAGGLISTRAEVQEAISAGADFVSTGDISLW